MRTDLAIAVLWGACMLVSAKRGRKDSGLLGRARLWLPLAFLVVAFVGISQSVDSVQTEPERVEVKQKPNIAERKKGTMNPGRVVSLQTNKGTIDLVLFEQDCPKTTARIVEFVEKGHYNGVKFGRVEKNELIQIADPGVAATPVKRELRDGLINSKGAVGMARGNDPDGATCVFYILLEPWRHLDSDYTVFARLVAGMDVAHKIAIGDTISKATVRKLTPRDRKRFDEVLRIEAEQNTQ